MRSFDALIAPGRWFVAIRRTPPTAIIQNWSGELLKKGRRLSILTGTIDRPGLVFLSSRSDSPSEGIKLPARNKCLANVIFGRVC
jgi:hypothetical protein